MSSNATADVKELLTALLNEEGNWSMDERRRDARQPFVRPATLVFGDRSGERMPGFTRDLSDSGIGLMHRFSIGAGDIATVTIGRLWDGPVTLKCRCQWCTAGNSGWFQSGWQVLSAHNCSGS